MQKHKDCSYNLYSPIVYTTKDLEIRLFSLKIYSTRRIQIRIHILIFTALYNLIKTSMCCSSILYVMVCYCNYSYTYQPVLIVVYKGILYRGKLLQRLSFTTNKGSMNNILSMNWINNELPEALELMPVLLEDELLDEVSVVVVNLEYSQIVR